MCFKKLTAIGGLLEIKPSPPVRISNKCCLRRVVWHRDTRGAAILVDACLANDAFNLITVRERLAQSLEYNACDTFLLKQNKSQRVSVELLSIVPSVR